MTAGSKTVLKAVLLITASVGLSGCAYDVGLGYASDGYFDDGYGCDPYGGYDAYYDCDYGQGFANIGFAGGYYDNFYYPGSGIFLFDTFGRRYPMREQYRRYWGERRHNWYRENRGRDVGRNRYEGRERGYENDPRYGRTRSPDRQAGGIRDRNDDRRGGRRDGTRNGNDQWRGGKNRGQDSGDDNRPRNQRGSWASDGNATPISPREVLPTPQNVTSAEQPPEPRGKLQRRQPPRSRMPEGGVERPD